MQRDGVSAPRRPVATGIALVVAVCGACACSSNHAATGDASHGSGTTPTDGASDGSGSGCPYAAMAAAAGLDDGCGSAIAGTPQVPDLLSAYGSNRPDWDVAGVDYAVGAPASLTYTDPATGILPAGCTYSSGSIAVTCSGDNIVLQGWDFTLHGGIKLTMSGANDTITKNMLAAGTNCADPIISATIAAGSTLTFTYNSIDGGGPTTCTGGNVYNTELNIGIGNGSTLTARYNYFAHAYQDDIDVRGPDSGTGGVDMRFNLFVDNGLPTNHSDNFQTCGGILGPIDATFNTMSNNYANHAWTQMLHAEAQCTGTLDNTTISQNVIIAISGSSTACTGGSYPTNCAANELFACKDDAGSNAVGTFAGYENYVDVQGSLSYTADDCTGQASASGITWGTPKPNVDLRTGATFAK